MKDGNSAGAGTTAGGKNGAPSSAASASGAGASQGSGSSPSSSGAPAKAASPPPAVPAPGKAGEVAGTGSSPSAPASPAALSEAPAASKPRASTGIPGVHVDPAGEDEIGGESHDEESGLQRILKAQAPETPPATGAGKEEPGEGGEPKTPAEGEASPPPKPKFKLGDMEFDSEDVAAHTMKSFRGQAASVAQRARDLSLQQQQLVEALGQIGLTLDTTGKVVRGSQPPSSPANASTQAQPSGAASASPADLGTPDGVRSFLDGALNWNQLPDLIKMYEGQHGVTLGPAVAMRLVMEEVIPKMWAAIQGHTKSALEPVQNIIGANQTATAVRELFHGMGEYVYPDGTPAYPEMLDSAEASAVHQVWLDLGNEGISPEILMSPKGVQMAVSLYRDLKGMKSRGQTPASSSSSAPPAPASHGNVDRATEAVRSVMQSLEAARGAVSPDLSSSEGQPFRPSNEANDRSSQVRRAIRESRGKEIIPGVRFQ